MRLTAIQPLMLIRKKGRHALTHLYVLGRDDNRFGFYLTASAAGSGDMDDRAPVNAFRLALEHFGTLRGLWPATTDMARMK